MRAVKLIIVNVVVLAILCVAAEIGARGLWTAQTCAAGDCNFSRLTSIRFQSFSERLETKFLGITQFDPDLGYAPNPGFDDVIVALGWDNVETTIDADGFRVTNTDFADRAADILVVGDSFTFGDQVSNHETWAACLERRLDRRVQNGGVFGYGAAQALLRAELELEKRPYGAVVLSILVGGDLERDRMDYRIGFPRPAVVRGGEGVAYAPVPDPGRPGTRYALKEPRRLLVLLYENSIIAATLMDRLLKVENMTGDRLQTVHENAASIEEIAEFVLARFDALAVEEKVLLLQYREDLTREGVLYEREMLRELAAGLEESTLVDTYDSLAAYAPEEVWAEHHNVKGNEVVCAVLAEEGFGL